MNAFARSRQESARGRLYATPAQVQYLARLLHEAFAHCFPTPGFDVHHLERTYKADASAEIDRLIRAKASGWQR